MSIFVIMANSSYHQHFLWIPLGYASCIVLIILMSLIEASDTWKALIYIITGFILVFLLEVTYQIFKKITNKNGKKSTLVFQNINFFHIILKYHYYFVLILKTFSVREEIFYEYTFQMYFQRPSKNWVINLF